MNISTFESGLDVQSYVGTLRNYRSFVRSHLDEAQANRDHVAQLKTVTSAASQPVRATIMTEDWCGDSACNLPVLAALFSAAGIDLRIHRGSEQKELRDYYHAAGVHHIPVVSIWDGDFREIGRWIEAPAAVSVRKDAWKAERPEFMELYRAKDSDKDAAKRFATLYREFMDEMMTWYKTGMWDETTREITEGVMEPGDGAASTSV